MTRIDEQAQMRPSYRARTPVELTAQQLAGIDRFHVARHVEDAAAGAASLSREERLTRDRERDVVRREQEAIVARCEHQLRHSGHVMSLHARRRVVLAHRSPWFVAKVAALLAEHDVYVVASLDNGADAVGAVVAEQPDLLLVEDSLAMVTGEQVIRDVRLFSPDTVSVAHVAYSDRVGALLEAGARAVFTRQIPPADVAEALLELLRPVAPHVQ